MFSIDFHFISGMSLGIEFVEAKDLEYVDGNASYVVLDLLIVRVLFIFEKG